MRFVLSQPFRKMRRKAGRTPACQDGCNARVQPIIRAVVMRFSSFRRWAMGAARVWLLLSFALGAQAQGQASPEVSQETADAGRGRILLVLPFDNRTGQPSLDWIREAGAEILSSRFTSAGFAPMSRADRIYALDHLGTAGSISAIAREFAEAGADTGRGLNCGGQLFDRWGEHCGRGARGGCSRNCV